MAEYKFYPGNDDGQLDLLTSSSLTRTKKQ